jgi:hypothetical protein
MGKIYIIAGAVLILVGLLSSVVPLFRLPGDIRYEGQQIRVYVPAATCSVVSIIITLLLNISRK